eukprot:jgi/Psemu1/304285/fgenesh1_kg.144_\
MSEDSTSKCTLCMASKFLFVQRSVGRNRIQFNFYPVRFGPVRSNRLRCHQFGSLSEQVVPNVRVELEVVVVLEPLLFVLGAIFRQHRGPQVEGKVEFDRHPAVGTVQCQIILDAVPQLLLLAGFVVSGFSPGIVGKHQQPLQNDVGAQRFGDRLEVVLKFGIDDQFSDGIKTLQGLCQVCASR